MLMTFIINVDLHIHCTPLLFYVHGILLVSYLFTNHWRLGSQADQLEPAWSRSYRSSEVSPS